MEMARKTKALKRSRNELALERKSQSIIRNKMWRAAQKLTRQYSIPGGFGSLQRCGGHVRGHVMTHVTDDLRQDKIDFPESHRGCPWGYVWVGTAAFEPRFTKAEFYQIPKYVYGEKV
jgi:hypothetical protein